MECGNLREEEEVAARSDRLREEEEPAETVGTCSLHLPVMECGNLREEEVAARSDRLREEEEPAETVGTCKLHLPVMECGDLREEEEVAADPTGPREEEGASRIYLGPKAPYGEHRHEGGECRCNCGTSGRRREALQNWFACFRSWPGSAFATRQACNFCRRPVGSAMR